jgi:hypothetical protein
VVTSGLPDDDVRAVDGVHERDEAHQRGELVLVIMLGGIRPGLVRDTVGRVGNAGALFRQLEALTRAVTAT